MINFEKVKELADQISRELAKGRVEGETAPEPTIIIRAGEIKIIYGNVYE